MSWSPEYIHDLQLGGTGWSLIHAAVSTAPKVDPNLTPSPAIRLGYLIRLDYLTVGLSGALNVSCRVPAI